MAPREACSLRSQCCEGRLNRRVRIRGKLVAVGHRPRVFVLYVVLMFQLAIGMHWPAALAVPLPTPASGVSAGHCPMHPAALAPEERAVRTVRAARTGSHDLLRKHECCRTPGCQCQCAFPAMSAEPTLLDHVPASAAVVPCEAAPAANWRSDESLRPPIA
jgi:hypothetical protein